MKRINVLIIALLISIVSCTKVNIQPKEATIKQASTTVKQFDKWIVRREFVVTQYYLNNEPNNTIFPDCALDNILYFYPDGRLIELEGQSKCGLSDTADYGTYELTDSTLYLNTVNIRDQYFKIIEFTPDRFKVRQTSPLFPVGADFESLN